MSAAVRTRGIGFGIFTLIMVALFVGLGVWQLGRRVEKHALIAALTERLATSPVPLPPASEWSGLTPGKDEFRRVSFDAIYEPVPAARVYSSGSAVRDDIAGPGIWAFMPALLPGGGIVVINTGFVPDATPDLSSNGSVAKRFVSRVPARLTGYIRFPETAGLLTPAASPEKRLWFNRDHFAMARALDWDQGGKTVAPFYVDLETPVPASGIPKPGPLEVHLRDDHMQYAITWFSLAGAVLIAFGVWLRAQRRASKSHG